MEAVIDVDKIRENAAKVRSMAAGKELTLMLKADAYNHGADVVAVATQEFADAFGVAVPEEARRLKAVHGFAHGITVYSPLPREIPAVVAEGFVPVIYSAECLEALRYSGGAEVDIKIDINITIGAEIKIDFDIVLIRVLVLILALVIYIIGDTILFVCKYSNR